MNAEKPERLVPDMRNVRYGEVLIVDTTETIATVLRDEFENSYTLPF